MIFTPERLAAFRQLLDPANRVMIVGHRSPDGDAVGSSMALAHLIRSLGKEADVWMPDAFPHFLMSVPGADCIRIYEGDGKAGNAAMEAADVICCLDFNKMERTGSMSQMLLKSETPKVMIDHHMHPSEGFAVTFSETQASSTCELVYLLTEALDYKAHVSLDMAQCVYTGLITDTGSFKYNVHPDTHRVAGELIALGLDSADIQGSLFDTSTRDRLGLLGYVLNDKLVHHPSKRASYMTLTKEDLTRFNYKRGDTEGFVNYGLSIQDVQFTALASEKDGVVKISFRSKGEIDVNVMAKELFGGGGHQRAAGARSEEPMSRVIEIIEEMIASLPDA